MMSLRPTYPHVMSTLAVFVALAAWSPATAQAGTFSASVSGRNEETSTITFIARPGENNLLTVNADAPGGTATSSAVVTLHDAGARVTVSYSPPYGACAQLDPYTGTCAGLADHFQDLRFDLGDGANTFSGVGSKLGLKVYGGPGADAIVGGGGSDVLSSDRGRFTCGPSIDKAYGEDILVAPDCELVAASRTSPFFRRGGVARGRLSSRIILRTGMLGCDATVTVSRPGGRAYGRSHVTVRNAAPFLQTHKRFSVPLGAAGLSDVRHHRLLAVRATGTCRGDYATPTRVVERWRSRY